MSYSRNVVKSERRRQRQEILEAERRTRQRKQRNRRLVLGGIALAVVLLLGGIAFTAVRELNAPLTGVQSFSGLERGHTTGPVSYPQSPPVGGVHNPAWQNCGYYSSPVANENAVHSLEHGAVWITYKPDLPQDQIDELKRLAEDQDYILVSPYANQSSPIVATAWNHQLQLQSADDKDLDRFIRVFKERAGDAPEPGAACSGGTSATVG